MDVFQEVDLIDKYSCHSLLSRPRDVCMPRGIVVNVTDDSRPSRGSRLGVRFCKAAVFSVNNFKPTSTPNISSS